MLAITAILAITALIVASATDIRTREVPDWLSYAMIVSGIAVNGIYSLAYSDYSYIIQSLLGLACMGAIAFLMFKTGQWGGGDSKILAAIGALAGLELSIGNFLLAFFMNILLVGALYGILWGAFLGIKHHKLFAEKVKNIMASSRVKQARVYTPIISLAPFALFALRPSLLSFIICACISFLINMVLWVYILSKAFEEAFMYKFIDAKKLTEGDWIADKIVIKGKYICGPKDLGISKAQIRKLISMDVQKVKIKEGIPFIPPFLLSFILTLFTGNIFILILS